MERELDQASTSRLLAALYGEAGEAGSSIEPESAEASELASLRELRSLLASLPEEEPSSAVTAKLLAAAARPERATVSPLATPGEGLWARILRWFQPLGLHPALAGVASLVLVVTVGGVLYMTGRADKAAESDFSSQGVKSAPANEPSAVSKAERPNADVREDGSGSDGAGEGAPARTKSFDDETSVVDESEKRALQTNKPPAGKRANAPKPPKGGKKITGAAKGSTGLELGASTTIDLDKAVPSPDPTPADAPPPVATQPEPEATRGAPAKTDVTVDEAKKSKDAKEPSLAGLRKSAAAAAKKSNCAQVKKIGDRVRKRDGRYYDTVFLRDSSIGRCYRARK